MDSKKTELHGLKRIKRLLGSKFGTRWWSWTGLKLYGRTKHRLIGRVSVCGVVKWRIRCFINVSAGNISADGTNACLCDLIWWSLSLIKAELPPPCEQTHLDSVWSPFFSSCKRFKQPDFFQLLIGNSSFHAKERRKLKLAIYVFCSVSPFGLSTGRTLFFLTAMCAKRLLRR